MHNHRMLGFVSLLSIAAAANAQTSQPSPTIARTDVYHVHFTKAVPGQAAALGKSLETQDPKAPMPGHFIVLRHQQGDDWDFCVIEHLGAKATVDAAPTAPNPGRNLRAWHADTFAAGPSWAEFSKAMALGDSSEKAKSSVYTVAVWQEAAGHREQLEKALSTPNPASKIPVSQILLQHLEGGPWQFLAISRHNSWQDFGADQAASATGSGPDGWSEVRQHSTSHHDTLADRIAPK